MIAEGDKDLIEKSPRVSKLREGMLDLIPLESKEDKISLRNSSLEDFFSIYLSWADRFIRPAPRSVSFWSGYELQGKLVNGLPDLSGLVLSISQGKELTDYLSAKLRGKVKLHGNRKRSISWADGGGLKDLALNAYDLHHLHVNPNDVGGPRRDSDHLLFAEFNRRHATIVCVGDHKCFNDGRLEEVVTAYRQDANYVLQGVYGLGTRHSVGDRKRLMRNGITVPIEKSGQVIVSNMITTAGSSIYQRLHADKMYSFVLECEQAIENGSTGLDLKKKYNAQIKDGAEYEYAVHYGDLLLVDLQNEINCLSLPWKR